MKPLLALFLLASACGVAAAQVSGFNGSAGWTLNGANATGYNSSTGPATGTNSTPTLSATTAQLLPNQAFSGQGVSGAASSIFYNTAQAIGSFNASFTYQASGGGSSGVGDGVAFVIQSSSTSAIGSQSGSGATTIPTSFATAFSYNSSTPGNDFVIDGVSPTYSTTGSINLANNQHPMRVTLSYNSLTLYETITDTVTGTTYSTSKNVDINAIVGGQTAFVGFTAGSSASYAGVTISNFTFTPVTVPGAAGILKPVVPNGWGSCVAPNGYGGDTYQQTGVYGDEYFSPAQQTFFQQSGMTLIRADLTWNNIEFSQGNYNWSYYDGLINNLQGSGVTVMFILDYDNTPVYNSAIYQQPALTGYANFAAAAAKHFQGKNVIFEIYNEPNFRGFTPAQYTTFATAAQQAMRAAVPNVTIIAPAEGEADSTWRQGILAAGAGASLNAFSYHPYSYQPEDLFNNSYYASAVTADILTYTPAGQVPMPLMISEDGSYGDSLPHQASFYSRLFVDAQLYGIPLITNYIYQDATPATDNSPANNQYGMIYANNTPKPAYTAVKNLISSLNGYEQIGRINTGSGSLFDSVYKKGTSLAEAIWSSNSPGDTALPYIHLITTGSAEYNQILNAVYANSNAVIAPPSFTTQLMVTAPTTAQNGIPLGKPFQVTVTAMDEYNNVASSYNGTVHFTSTDPTAVLPADGTLTNGVGTFNVTLSTNAYEYVTATDTTTGSITNALGGVPGGNPTITLSASANPMTVNQGTSFQNTIGVNYVYGYTSSANTTLSVSGVPSGVTASLSSTSFNGTGNSTLTLTVSRTAALGTYPLMLTAVNGSTNVTLSVPLTIGAGTTLATGSYLAPGQYLASTNGVCYLTGTSSGALVLYQGSGPANKGAQIWSSYGSGSGGVFYTIMQTDGNLVTYAGSSPSNNLGFIWNSNTPSGSTYTATVLDSQVVQILNGTTIIWQEPANGTPTFLLSDSLSSMTVNQGTSEANPMSVTYLAGFTGNVALSASNLPTGVTASFSPASLSATGNSYLTLSVSPTAAMGTSTFSVNATSGSTTRTVTIPLTIGAGSTLATNTFLAAGQYLVAPSGSCYLIDQVNGNLALYEGSGPSEQGAPIWSSNANANGADCYTIMQTDGNLVTYTGTGPSVSGTGNPIFDSATYTGSNYVLTVLDTDAIEILNGNAVVWQKPVDQLSLTSVASTQVHAGTPYSFNLSLTGKASVESRIINNALQLVFTFNDPVTSGTVAVNGTANVNGTPTFSGNTVTINLTGVADKQNMTVDISNLNGDSDASAAVTFGVLAGDVNGDGFVNILDLGQIRLHTNQPVTNQNCQYDINEDGAINILDLGQARLRTGRSIP